VGKTIYKFRKDRYEEDSFEYKDAKQKRREKLELKRFKNYNPEDFSNEYSSDDFRNKKQRKST
jgi:hypothetical protein